MKHFLYWFKRLFKKNNYYNLEADNAFINHWLIKNNPKNKNNKELYEQYGEFDLKNKIHILYKRKDSKFK